MREKLFAVGDDFWIETGDGERAFKVDGKALRLRKTFVLESSSGRGPVRDPGAQAERARQDGRSSATGRRFATVKKALVSPLRDRYSIETARGEDLEAKGNVVDHEFKIERGGEQVAEVSKRWFRVRDTYGIEIAPGQDDALILAVTVCIDQMGGRDL